MGTRRISKILEKMASSKDLDEIRRLALLLDDLDDIENDNKDKTKDPHPRSQA